MEDVAGLQYLKTNAFLGLDFDHNAAPVGRPVGNARVTYNFTGQNHAITLSTIGKSRPQPVKARFKSKEK